MPSAAERGSRKSVPGILFLSLVLPAPVLAGSLDGRIALEMEYLGESYFSEQQFTAADLGLPLGTSILFSDTTRFSNDTYLPGQKLDLRWENDPASAARLRVDSRTAYNRERASQDLDVETRVPAGNGGQWIFRGRGVVREDERSLVGHGDWQTRLLGSREFRAGSGIAAGLEGSWQHSRTRGDTVSYLYDYDIARARLFARDGSGWLPVWETRLEGTRKHVPGGEPGGYDEVRLTGTWRQKEGSQGLGADLRWRDYEVDEAVGRDMVSGEVNGYRRFWRGGASSVWLESRFEVSDYRGEDDLYFDSAELVVFPVWKREAGSWTLSAGPELELLTDWSGGDRGYQQWSGKAAAGRLIGLGGFVDLDLDLGYRNYTSPEAQAIEVSSLSTSLLRSDYWLLDALVLTSLPLPGRLSLEVVASSSWEWHAGESERIQVTFATVGVSRDF